MNILIVEDEPNYADTLEMFVDELGYHITGLAEEGQKALKLFRENAPDLVLLDINIEGEMSGIDLARIFQAERPTPVIFITSYDDKETFNKAKETVPCDYLIKPFDPDQLERSMELATVRAYAPSPDEDVFEDNRHVVLGKDFFFVKERNKLVKLMIADILWVSVEDKYCILHAEGKKFVIRQSLKELAEKLNPQEFVQTHRSHIVNIKKVEDIDLAQYTIAIAGEEISLGKSYKENLLYRLQTL
ncbi:MAG: response regulator [Roseivirga sp.]|uniref:LytR/AlgR family response regulator transcription factor n=1 Tax=Roseivirga sp. TaxID=1964215 RepID=UPI001B002FA3|nr:response regulator [Roseivirga sp.]MBO6662724.1 response regulator [Roseivirga sp.]MBO6909731.1 response regulator [Roseivirga sp.]